MKKPKILKVMSTCLLAVAVLVAAVLILTPKARAATIVESGTCGANLTWTLDSEGTLTIAGTGAMKDYDYSPSTQTGITHPWGNLPSAIRSVVIEQGVISIGDKAFHSCTSLTSVTIGDSVESIGAGAFQFCSNLTSVTIPDSIESIGYWAFYSCDSLTYNVYDNAKYLGNANNPYIALITATSDDITACTIHPDTKFICDSAFDYCESLTSVTIPDSVRHIGNSAFYYCFSLESVTIPDSVTYIGNYAFELCSSLESVTIPDNVESIGSAAFSSCSGLTNVTIPDSVEGIGDFAFQFCSSLASVTIPDSVTGIGDYAFRECSSLTDVYYGGSKSRWRAISIGSENSKLTGATIHYQHIHDYTLLPATTVNPTCTEKGYIEYTCAYGETYRVAIPVLDHDYSGPVVTVEPTCKTEGYIGNTCTRCDAVEVITVLEIRHQWSQEPTVIPPACELWGFSYYGCPLCGAKKDFTELSPLDHDYSGTVTVIEPTCTEQGYTIIQCIRCDKYIISDYTDEVGHKMVLVPASDPTCEKSGLTVGTACQRCGLVGVAQKEVPALGGECDFFDDPYTCKKCGYVRDTIPSDSLILAVEAEQESIAYGNTIKVSVVIDENPGFLGVNFDVKWDTAILELVGTDTTDADFNKVKTNVQNNTVVVTVGDPMLGVMYPSMAEKYEGTGKAVTLTFKVKDGADADATPKVYIERASYVKIGGASSDDVTVKSKNVHVVSTNHKHTPGAPATCTTSQICTHCFAVLDPAKGHKWVDATCTTPKTCSVCETTEGSALGHKTVVDKAVAPTCTTTGLTEGSHCSVCNEVFVAQQTIDALGHKTVVDKAVAPTCTTSGLTEGSHCSVCNEVFVAQKVVAALGHKEVIDKAVAPTCTTTGLTEGKHCSVCKETLVAQKVFATLPHTEAIDKAVAPTCTTTGLTEGKHCSVCNEILVAQKVVAALPHTEAIDKAVAPTCTKTGLTEGKHCSVCNEILVAQNVVPAIGGNCDYSADPSTCKHCGHVRANVEITGVTLRPTCSGLYFKGSFNFDEDLQVTQYGIAVSLYNRRPVADDSDSSSLYTIGENSVLISNILGGDGTGGKAWIFARAYALLEDGTYIYGQVVITNLQSVVETLDAQIFDGLGTKQKTALTDMYRQHTAAMQDWLIPKIKELV